MIRKSRKVAELSFYLFLMIMFMEKGAGLYDGLLIYKILFVIAMLFVFIKLILSEYTIYELFFTVTFGVLAVITNRISGEKGPLIIFAIVFGMQNIPLKRILKIGVICMGASFVIKAFVYMLRIPNVNAVYRSGRLGVIRSFAWDLGQPHPNITATLYLAIAAMIILILGEKYNWRHMLLLSIGDLIVYLYCVSNTGFIVGLLMIVSTYYIGRVKKIPCWMNILMALSYPLSVLFSCVYPWIMPEVISQFLYNNARTVYNRAMLSREFVKLVNLKFFGVKVINITDSRYTLDNSFLYCILFNGLICFLVVSICYCFYMRRYVIDKRYTELCITMFFMVEGIFEPFLFNTSFKNVTLFFCGECLWDYFLKKRKKDSRLICILKKNDWIEGLSFIDIIYAKGVYILDKLFETREKVNKKVTLLSLTIGIITAAIFLIMFPITRDFFVPYDIYEVLVEYNQVHRCIVLENVRRWIFAFMFSTGVTYLTLNMFDWFLSVRNNKYNHD